MVGNSSANKFHTVSITCGVDPGGPPQAGPVARAGPLLAGPVAGAGRRWQAQWQAAVKLTWARPLCAGRCRQALVESTRVGPWVQALVEQAPGQALLELNGEQ